MKKTEKKIITIFLAACLLLSFLTVNVFAEEKEPVEFRAYTWAEVDLLSTVMKESAYFEVTSGTSTFESNEIYVVRGEVTVADRIECGQNVKLVLTDGSELNAEKGIHVRGSLEIFGGAENTGTLIANLSKNENGFSCLGINKGDTACDISVHGGQLKLRHDGEESCVNSGSGYFTLYRGIVEAVSRDGNGILAETVTIYDGNLQCQSDTAAGVSGKTVTIYGGEINCEGFYGAGVEGKDITINGGTIDGNSKEGAGIGSGVSGYSAVNISSCNSITINDGYIRTSSYSGAAVGSGMKGSCSTITINGGTISAEINYGAAVGSGVGGFCKTVNINGGLIMNINFFDTGYAFHGDDGFGCKAGEMPDICLGQDVTLRYRSSFLDKSETEKIVTSESKNIKETLKDKRFIAVVPKEIDDMRNGGTGSFFSNGSTVILVACAALLLGGVAGLLVGKRYCRKDSNG